MNELYQKAAMVLFDRFVVNTSAVVVQQENGSYNTVKVPITPEMITTILSGGYSLGTYQQQLNNDKLKWICFDFDTDKKTDKALWCLTPIFPYDTFFFCFSQGSHLLSSRKSFWIIVSCSA